MQQTITLLGPSETDYRKLITLDAQLALNVPQTEITKQRIAAIRIGQTRNTLEHGQAIITPSVSSESALIALSIMVNGPLSTPIYQWIARARNLGTVRLIAFNAYEATLRPEQQAGQSAGLPPWGEQLRTLGFLCHKIEAINAPEISTDSWIWYFDIQQYKETPDWLNARHWAHPELWNKYRW